MDPGNGDPPQGSCTAEFEAGVVSGLATVTGEIAPASGPPITAEVEIEVGFVLANVSGMFSRNSELWRKNWVDEHPDAFYLSPYSVQRIGRLQQEWEAMTAKLLGDQGTYLSFNDMSLPRGGLFDIEATWDNWHNSHRLGTSVDVNRESFNVSDEMQSSLVVTKQLLLRPCRRAGGFVEMKSGGLHCDFRTQ